MFMPECIKIGNAELWHGDMEEVLPLLPPADLVIADPPYGVGENGNRSKSRGSAAGANKWKGTRNTTWAGVPATDYGDFDWDNKPASRKQIRMTRKAGKHCIIWGGNYFHLPPVTGWLVWDKMNTGDFADCELAWTNLPIAVRQFRHMWNGMLRDSEKNEPRCHPTQKPVALMKWCITKVKEPPKLIVDPFMGSSPVGIACSDMGIKYIGIEKMKRNFDIACERIDRAQQQGKLF
jgi:site-specific DNA-methyltransferase (adenine-specific)/modification methylase